MPSTTTRRLLLAGLALLPTPAMARQGAAPRLSADDQAAVDRAVAYLQGLTLARGRFTQTDARGHRSGGDFYLNRPGKIRFDYDPPNDLHVVSDGNQVKVQDRKLGTFEAYPLRSTPLAIFLAREIRLNGARVTKVERTAGLSAITVANREGQIVLRFAENPSALKGWTVIDGQGQQTQVTIESLAPVNAIDPAKFRLQSPPTNAGRAKA